MECSLASELPRFLLYFRGDLHRLQRLTWLVERTKNEQQNKKKNAAIGSSPVKIEFLKGAGLLALSTPYEVDLSG